jgi:hypothetical protein
MRTDDLAHMRLLRSPCAENTKQMLGSLQICVGKRHVSHLHKQLVCNYSAREKAA